MLTHQRSSGNRGTVGDSSGGDCRNVGGGVNSNPMPDSAAAARCRPVHDSANIPLDRRHDQAYGGESFTGTQGTREAWRTVGKWAEAYQCAPADISRSCNRVWPLRRCIARPSCLRYTRALRGHSISVFAKKGCPMHTSSMSRDVCMPQCP